MSPASYLQYYREYGENAPLLETDRHTTDTTSTQLKAPRIAYRG